MNTKQNWLAVGAYVTGTFLTAAPWHLAPFKPLYDDLAIFSRRDPIIPLGLMAMLIQGLILSYAYPIFSQGTYTVKTGARFGLLIGTLFASMAVFAKAAKQNVTSLPTWLVLEATYYLFQFSLVGAAIGAIYGKGEPAHGLG
ncbi:MAG: DUF1761 domain-containing protein [Nitrospirae bacterium]|nr:DUF1761 domain-containing protein [Nitrospirota bacterium]